MRLILQHVTVLAILLTAPLLALGTGPGYSAGRIGADYYQQLVTDLRFEYSTRIASYDSLLALSPPAERPSLLLEKGRLLEQLNPTMAMKCYIAADSLLPRNAAGLRSKLLLQFGSAAFRNKSYDLAMTANYRAMALDKPDSLEYLDVRALAGIVDIAIAFHDLRFAEQNIALAREKLSGLHHVPETEKSRLWFMIRMQQGIINLGKGDFDSAFSEFSAMRAFARDSLQTISLRGSFGLLYTGIGHLDKAERCYRDILAMPISHPNRNVAALNLLSLFVDRRDTQGAEKTIEKYRAELDALRGTVNDAVLYRNYALLCQLKGDWKNAVYNQERSLELHDSISRAMQAMEASPEIAAFSEKLTKEQQDDSERSRRQIVVIAIVLAAACLALLSLALVWRHKLMRERRQNTELAKRISDDSVSYRMKSRENIENLGERTRQLSAMTLEIAQTNGVLSRIKDTVAKAPRSEATDHIAALIRDLKLKAGIWDIFNALFVDIHPQFFERLHHVCPTLTNAETRMAAFSLMNLTMNEIADMTNRSVRTVGTIRYTMRRKLGIDTSTDVWMRGLMDADQPELDRLREASRRAQRKTYRENPVAHSAN